VTQTGVEEVGLETADGTLITRAVFASPVDLNGPVTVTLDVSNDGSVSRGVLTTDGQTAVRDVLADNTPTIPNEYGYGSDGTAVSESDASLFNEVITTSLEEILIQNADTTSEWEQIADVEPTDAVAINDSLAAAQVAHTTESDQLTRANTSFQTGTKYSNDEAESLQNSGDRLELEFELQYTLPESAVGVSIRMESTDAPEVEARIDDTVFAVFPDGGDVGVFDWHEFGDSANTNFGLDGWQAVNGGDLDPGTHTLTLEANTTNANFIVDVVAPYDTRFSYTFDNDTTGTGERASGPELYPDNLPVSFVTTDTRRNVTTANFELTANDVSNNFYVELANDGSTFTRFNNSTTGSASFASPESGVDTNINLSRYGSRTDATPTEGFNGQSINVWSLFANPDAITTDSINATSTRAVVSPDTITGETIREAGLKSDGTLLTRHEIAEFTLETGQRLASSESTAFNGDE